MAELRTAVEATDSAVYDSVSTLADRGILMSHGDRYALSGQGQLIADAIKQWDSTGRFLNTAPEYWQTHDASVIPQPFRRRLHEIGAYEVIKSVESQVTRHHRAVLSRLRAADHCEIISPFYSTEYHNAIPDAPNTRVLAHQRALETRQQRLRDGQQAGKEFEHVELRMTELTCSLAVGADFLLFGLPTHSGEPSMATVVSETESAVQWGRELFAEQWNKSESMN
jgi:predicted transcriptional regulator